MISALKRLVNSEPSPASNGSNGQTANIQAATNKIAQNAIATTSLINNGMQMISQSLQKKFSRGVNYNMKIVIRGDCNVGKTCLWLRLQGQPFKELYETSDEIKVANIQWNYKTTDDVVKVEIWDVVDRSKKKRNLIQQKVASSNTLKYDHSFTEAPVEASLDAEFIDVYKNANGCILVYDITKQWTWDYIERELPKIPNHIPVLVIGNHRDMNHHRNIDELKCKYFLENLKRGSLGSAVRYTETSMRTGYGMNYLYKFFNIPFLQLQRENLMHQLEINARETDMICEELEMIEENIEVDYNKFIDSLNSKRRQQQEENAKDALKNAVSIDQARKLVQEKEAAMAVAKHQAESQLSEPKKVINNIINKINTKVNENLPQPQQVSMSVTIDPSKKKTPSNLANSQSKTPINLYMEELGYDDDLNSFLNDPVKSEEKLEGNKKIESADDDEEVINNPMVTAFKEEIDSSDEENAKNKVKIQINVSDDEKEENKVESKTENIISKMTTHNSSSSNTSSNLGSSLNQFKNSSNFETISSTTSISLVNCDSTSQTSYSMPILENQMNDIKFSNDDFEFLEKVSTEKKSKSKSKKSSKIENESDDSKVKLKKKKSKSKNTDELLDFVEEKKEKKKSKKKDLKLNLTSNYLEDDDDNSTNANVKRDLDYEEL